MDRKKVSGNGSAQHPLGVCTRIKGGAFQVIRACGEMAGGTPYKIRQMHATAPRLISCRTCPFEFRRYLGRWKGKAMEVAGTSFQLNVCGHKIVIAGHPGPPKTERPPTKGRAPRSAPRPKPPSQLCTNTATQTGGTARINHGCLSVRGWKGHGC